MLAFGGFMRDTGMHNDVPGFLALIANGTHNQVRGAKASVGLRHPDLAPGCKVPQGT